MRPLSEISFRLRQEAANLALWASFPPKPQIAPAPLTGLPDPQLAVDLLRNTQFAQEITNHAEQILLHRFPMLGITVETGSEIDWRRDYVSKISSPPLYFRRVKYLDQTIVGDHKFIWELNRHQHLVLLAQAWRFTGDKRYFEEIIRQLESWFAQNPFQCGINWTSALEVAFRAWSWIWIYHLAGDAMTAGFRGNFLAWLSRHGAHLLRNLSIYFSPNTHLLGEAVVLHALGVLFPGLPGAEHWRTVGRGQVLKQMEFQVKPDGSHFEQSTYYHVYALDMLLLHHIVEPAPPAYVAKLCLMADYLAALMGRSRSLQFFGDDDGGRFFHPYGCHRRYGRATLATCSVHLGGKWGYEAEDLEVQAMWWVGPRAIEAGSAAQARSQLFADSGMAILTSEAWDIIVKAGPFGWAGAGHSHSDVLSMTASCRGVDVLVDAGTYTYVGEPQWRQWFRGSVAHNTLRVDGRDQADAVGPFRWTNKPTVRVRGWHSDAVYDFLDAECVSGVTHRRRVLLLKPDLVLIVDSVDGSPGLHDAELFWHFGAASGRDRVIFPATDEPQYGEGGEYGWQSPAYGVKQAKAFAHVKRKTQLPAVFVAALDGSAEQVASTLTWELQGKEIHVSWSGASKLKVVFSEEGCRIVNTFSPSNQNVDIS